MSKNDKNQVKKCDFNVWKKFCNTY